MKFYAEAFGWPDALLSSVAPPSFNVAPSTHRPVLHLQAGVRRVDDLHWGYRSGRLGDDGGGIATFVGLEKIYSHHWSPLFEQGRAVVPASAWYEWTGEMDDKQPWHIHRRDREPLFILALANFAPSEMDPTESGFAMITANAEGGMVDTHDRRPVVLSAADAARWLDPTLSIQQAQAVAATEALCPEMFEWHKVSRELNQAGPDGAHLIVPIEDGAARAGSRYRIPPSIKSITAK